MQDKMATAAFKGAGKGGKSKVANSRVGRPGLANNTILQSKWQEKGKKEKIGMYLDGTNGQAKEQNNTLPYKTP